MKTFPSAKSTTGLGSRIRVRPEHRKEWGEDKIDAFRKFFGQRVLQLSSCRLEWKQFLCLVVFPEVSITFVVMYMNLVLSWGSLIVFVVQLMKFVIAMPLFMVNGLLGAYSQKSYLRMWDMVPIFRGIGWSVAIYQLLTELFNISVAGLALIFIPKFFVRNMEWVDCEFKGASKNCYAMYPDGNYTGECCLQGTPGCKTYVHFSTLDYLRHRVLSLATSEAIHWIGIDTSWIAGIIVVWALVFALMIPGFLRFKNLIAMVIFSMTVLCVIPLSVVNFLLSFKFPVPQNMLSSTNMLTDYRFWIQMVVYVTASEMPGFNVLMGSYAASNVTPDIAAFIVYTIKFFLLTLTLNCFSVAVSLLMEHYRVADGRCFHLTGVEVLLAVVPDIITRAPLPQVLGPLWLLMVVLWGTLSAVLITTAFVETLTDTFPKLIQYRLCTCSMVCVTGLAVNIMALHNNYFYFFNLWTKNGMTYTLLCLLAVYLIALYIYSMKNLRNDYHFVYGVPLKQFWIFAIKGCSLIVWACFALIIFEGFDFVAVKSDKFLDMIMYFLLTVILAPIPVYAVYIYTVYHASRKRTSLLSPAASWGPLTAEEKQQRKKFNPQREMHYRMELTRCRHNCLLNSQKILDEVERLNENRRKLIEGLGEEALQLLQEA